MAEPYASIGLLSGWNRSQSSEDAIELDLVLNAASRAIDQAVGRGIDVFHGDAVASVRQFHADDPYVLTVRDFHTTTGLVVATDTTDDGTYDTVWGAADYIVEPTDPDDGEPYNQLVAVASKRFPTSGRRPRVQVTAQWGWAAVPRDIMLATQLLANRYLKRRTSAELGVLGIGESVARIARTDPDVQGLIEPYMKLAGIA